MKQYYHFFKHFLVYIYIFTNLNPYILYSQLGKHYCSEEKIDWITIFIHGTVGLRANLNLPTIIRLFKDDIIGSPYAQNVARIRQHPYLFTMQPIQDLGLRPVCDACSTPCGPYIFAILLNKLYNKYYSSAHQQYYTFGWSGLLSYTCRYLEAHIFYQQLKQELIRLKTLGRKPKVRVIAYSHAANLVLNCGALRTHCSTYKQDTFCIDELVMIGTPVQRANSHLITHPIFKRIYHIYSSGDAIQRLDLFSPCNLISHRTFKYPLPSHVTQIQLKIRAKLLRLPGKCLPQGKRGNVDQSPGHTELWFFGWVHNNYRQNFTLYPLPAAILVPYITHTLEKYAPQAGHVQLDIRPDEEKVLLKDKATSNIQMLPFLNTNEFTHLKWRASAFHPGQPAYIARFMGLQESIDPSAYM